MDNYSKVRTTADSIAEGRMKVSASSNSLKKKKRKALLDGVGGCGGKKKKY